MMGYIAMTTTHGYRTEQESFWAGKFGDDYAERNKAEKLVVANTILFGRILRAAPGVRSIIELGCNIGLNLRALGTIDPGFQLAGLEINERAAAIAREQTKATIRQGSALNPMPDEPKYDLAFTSGMLIHIAPEQLSSVYDNLYRLSRRYVMICEYYNPQPVEVTYRGHTGRLFKRDFAGEMIDKYGLRLLDYGFVYHRDSYFPQDDLNWFLLERAS